MLTPSRQVRSARPRNSRSSTFPTSSRAGTRCARSPTGRSAKGFSHELDLKGIIGVAYWDNGFKIADGQQPVEDARRHAGPEDAHSVVEGSGSADEGVRRGAAGLAFSESYQALQTGVVNGTENTPSNIYTQKMHEVQKNGALTNHGYIGYAVIVNKKFWEGLPPDIRAQLDKAMAEATEYTNGIAQKENDDAMEAMKKSGRIAVLRRRPPK